MGRIWETAYRDGIYGKYTITPVIPRLCEGSLSDTTTDTFSMTIWQTLPKPFFALAPMEDVTDTVFRRMLLNTGRPDVYFTEFTNVDGLQSVGDKIVSQRLTYHTQEHPIIAQVWGNNPDNFALAAKRIIDLGFDGIDINFGCPQKSVTSQGCGAALINKQPLVHEIIQATLSVTNGTIPLSIKTRIGINTIITDEWIPFLLSHDIAALTIHGRTAKEESKVPCHWDEIAKAVTIRNNQQSKTIIIGNGDVLSKDDGLNKVKESGVDGIMIGRGIFTNPFLFSDTPNGHTVGEYLELLIQHVTLYDDVWQGKKHYPILKKYYKIYVAGFQSASDLRAKLMETHTTKEAKEIVTQYMSENKEMLSLVRV
jgi:tRNA-dihydrouridine synthase